MGIHHTLLMTMVDGKVCNSLTQNRSSQTCYICGATPKQMNIQSENVREDTQSVQEEYFGKGATRVTEVPDSDGKVGEWNNFWLNYNSTRSKYLSSTYGHTEVRNVSTFYNNSRSVPGKKSRDITRFKTRFIVDKNHIIFPDNVLL
nr:unnamed protein product [Callosobruchus analis]